MRVFCEECGAIVDLEFVEEREDEHGRRWEVYRCPLCGAEQAFAVA